MEVKAGATVVKLRFLSFADAEWFVAGFHHALGKNTAYLTVRDGENSVDHPIYTSEVERDPKTDEYVVDLWSI